MNDDVSVLRLLISKLLFYKKKMRKYLEKMLNKTHFFALICKKMNKCDISFQSEKRICLIMLFFNMVSIRNKQS